MFSLYPTRYSALACCTFILCLIAFSTIASDNLEKATDRLTSPINSIEPTKPGSHEYQIAKSNDDKLCRHMANLLNRDLRKYGYEQYRKHHEFNKIEWQKTQFSSERYGRTEYEPVRGALIDIDNDGAQDFVVKWQSSLNGILRDILYVLDSEAAKRGDKLVNRELFESKRKLSMGGILEPFIFDNRTYVYIRPLFELIPASRSTFAVIASYSGGRLDNIDRSSKIDERCYFKRVPTNKR